jgi:POT family proton-dependent oligopeptide transporter
MAVPAVVTFPVGLLLVAGGTGLLKPNLTVLLGSCYPRNAHATRESAFSVFYMSIQVSAIAAPLVTGLLGEYVNWHAGFGAAAVGMAIGIACFLRGRRYLGDVGRLPASSVEVRARARLARRSVIALATVVTLLVADGLAGTLRAQHVIAAVGLTGLVVPVLAFRAILRSPEVDAGERHRVRGYVRVFLASALFWMLFSQSLSLLSQFAKDSTDRVVLGFGVPASWFQSLHPLFVLLGAPVAAWLWPRLRTRAVAAKMGAGLALAGLSFLLMALAAHLAQHGRVSPGWLVAAYLSQSVGELALAPVGLAVTVAAAPRAFASQMMGLWWLSAALGAGVGGQLVRLAVVFPTELYFLAFGIAPLAGAAALLAVRDRMARLLVDRPDPTPAAPVGAAVAG